MKLETLMQIVGSADADIMDKNKQGWDLEQLKEATWVWMERLTLHRLLLLKPLHFGQFVPCKDGVPLAAPRLYDHFITRHKVTEWDIPTFEGNGDLQKCYEYEAAEKLVIFEGWEWEKAKYSETFYISNKHFGIDFYGHSNAARVCVREEFGDFGAKISDSIKTISDLANATQENPITLR